MAFHDLIMHFKTRW